MQRLGACLVWLVFSTAAFAQGWALQHHYPLIDPWGTRYDTIDRGSVLIFRGEKLRDVYAATHSLESFRASYEWINLSAEEEIWYYTQWINPGSDSTSFLLELDPDFDLWSYVDLFVMKEDSLWEHHQTGHQLPPSQRKIRNARNWCWLDFGPEEKKKVFIRFRSRLEGWRRSPGLRILDRSSIQEYEGLDLKKLQSLLIGKLQGVNHFQAKYSLEFFVDTSGDYSWPRVAEDWEEIARFANFKDYWLSKEKEVWCRFKLINSSEQVKHYLFDAGGDAPTIEVYLPESDGKFKKVRTGKKMPAAEKYIDHTLSLVDYSLAGGDTAFIFFHYEPLPANRPELTSVYDTGIIFFDQNHLLSKTRKMGVWKGLIIGVLLFQLLYFLLRSLLQQDALGLSYAALVLGFLLLFLWIENSMNTYLALQVLYYQQPILLLMAFILIAGALFVFTNRYLAMARRTPWLSWSMRILLVLIVLFQGLNFFQNTGIQLFSGSWWWWIDFADYMLAAFGLLLLLSLTAAAVIYYRGEPEGLSYLIAFSPFLLVMVVCVYKYLENTLDSHWWYNFMYGGFILTSVLFAVVGARRHNNLRLEQQKGQ